ncbi:MAG: hypothetical protein VW058_08495 [Flavobacteriaceae bacterium]
MMGLTIPDHHQNRVACSKCNEIHNGIKSQRNVSSVSGFIEEDDDGYVMMAD